MAFILVIFQLIPRAEGTQSLVEWIGVGKAAGVRMTLRTSQGTGRMQLAPPPLALGFARLTILLKRVWLCPD